MVIRSGKSSAATATATMSMNSHPKCFAPHATIKAKNPSWTHYGAAVTGIKSVKTVTASAKHLERGITRIGNINAYYLEPW